MVSSTLSVSSFRLSSRILGTPQHVHSYSRFLHMLLQQPSLFSLAGSQTRLSREVTSTCLWHSSELLASPCSSPHQIRMSSTQEFSSERLAYIHAFPIQLLGRPITSKVYMREVLLWVSLLVSSILSPLLLSLLTSSRLV